MNLISQLSERREAFHHSFSDLAGNNPAVSFYGSFDLRDSGDKLVPVDANFFPSGWNNLAQESLNLIPAKLKEWFEQNLTDGPPQKIVLISENHTLNTFYFENLRVLCSLFSEAGYETRAGYWQHPSWEGPVTIETSSQMMVEIHPVSISDGKVTVGSDWSPDIIISNNDGSVDPGFLWGQITIPTIPLCILGWHRRKKTWFFDLWNKHAARLGRQLDLDPWSFEIETRCVGPVDFKSKTGLEGLAETVDATLKSIQENYKIRAIKRTPKVFIKHSSGTYGIGVMTVENIGQILSANRKTRNKMSIGKGKRFIDEVVVQEAVPTVMRTGVADEAVMYTLGLDCVGGFLRCNERRGSEENLNSMGMTFDSLEKIEPSVRDIYTQLARHCSLILGQESNQYGKA